MSVFLHNSLKLDAARMSKRDTVMFHDESRKLISFSIKRSKVTSHKSIAGVGHTGWQNNDIERAAERERDDDNNVIRALTTATQWSMIVIEFSCLYHTAAATFGVALAAECILPTALVVVGLGAAARIALLPP